MGGNGSLVHLDQGAHQGQADSHASLAPVQRIIRLNEHIKNRIDQFGGHSSPVILDADAGLPVLRLNDQFDHSTGIGVFDGIGQQILKDLQ